MQFVMKSMTILYAFVYVSSVGRDSDCLQSQLSLLGPWRLRPSSYRLFRSRRMKNFRPWPFSELGGYMSVEKKGKTGPKGLTSSEFCFSIFPQMLQAETVLTWSLPFLTIPLPNLQVLH